MSARIGEGERLIHTLVGVYAMLLGLLFIQGFLGGLLGVLGLAGLVAGLTGRYGLSQLIPALASPPEAEEAGE